MRVISFLRTLHYDGLLRRRGIAILFDEKMIKEGKVGGVATNFFVYMCEKGAIFNEEFVKLKINEVSFGKLTMSMEYDPLMTEDEIQPSLHGGITATVIDHVGGFCAWTLFDKPGMLLSTVNLRIDFLEPLTPEDRGMICEGIVAHETKTLIRADLVCWNSNKTKKIAIGW